jgi:hypothetical protein
VPVDADCSVSVYNPEGNYEKNPYDAYTLNNLTAKKAAAAPSISSSAVATARSRTACRSQKAGTTPYGSIARALKY